MGTLSTSCSSFLLVVSSLHLCNNLEANLEAPPWRLQCRYPLADQFFSSSQPVSVTCKKRADTGKWGLDEPSRRRRGPPLENGSSERKRAKTSPENETMRMHSQLGRISSVLLKAKFRPVLCSGDSEGAVPTREKGPACCRELAELWQWGVGGWQPELQASNSRFSATAISG